ncbi:MAG: hypothetical protein J0I07_06305 [Myxococcales bacterium]|nr:hypothetical protein [Myxococcales bacterium]
MSAARLRLLMLLALSAVASCSRPLNLVPSSREICERDCRQPYYRTWAEVDRCLKRCEPH